MYDYYSLTESIKINVKGKRRSERIERSPRILEQDEMRPVGIPW
jgi:hypothetical protein